ncbi:hypothetical protein NAL32_04590 [Chryseobacterium sp. Ch-15]|uniref:Uncharacterized protein n=1 Tax=Chryseobacterium muglaense TaxID=2893752 RepID=A0A9Q3YPD6_9FLAO|nr:hypothetical protein [Chryseobacterium muglaense]MBD3904018.1 hypothetical protein [Chryseobacterium muglaense]MCC9032796.1 hypothetical protein [Chryseobacterium muglaense]MCM2553667.1 hypothetical protein [Chryseobacterium muglaense]
MKNINVFGYATFGSPNGFTQSCIYGNKNLEKALKTFDLKTDGIQLLSPSDRIYSIRKEGLGDKSIVSYSVYTYAKEKNSNRTGTFIGTSLIFSDETPTENLILNSLHQIHQNLKNNNVSNNVLNSNHSKDFNIQNIFSKDFEKLQYQTNKFDFVEWENSGKTLVVYTTKFEQNEIQNLFKKSFPLLPKYDTIFFIDSKEIAEFVSQKRLFRIIDKNGLDQEIQILEEERKQKVINTISRFEKEKEKLEEDRKNELVNLKKQIEQNEQKHSENQKKIEESKSNLTSLDHHYNNFLNKISALVSALNSEKQLEEVNHSFKQLEREFNTEKRKLGTPLQTSSLFNTNTTNHVSTQYTNPYQRDLNDRNTERSEKNRNFGTLAIISIIINLLFVGGATYFYFMYYEEVKEIVPQEIIIEKPYIEKNYVVEESKLNPIPNDFAKDENNKKLILDQLVENNTSIDKTVELIFEKNKIIRDSYQFQKDDYADELIRKNPGAFNSNKILQKKDSLTKIPFFSSSLNPNISTSN